MKTVPQYVNHPPAFWETWRFATILIATFLFSLLFAGHTLEYPWFYDDYNLVRPYSSTELLQSLHGNWDPTGLDNPTYRPLINWVMHARCILFGENILLHRLFQLFALALFVSLTGYALLLTGLRMPFVIGGGCFAIIAKANSLNIAWLTAGTHAISGIPMALVCVLVAKKPTPLTTRSKILIFFLTLTSLFIREENIAIFPLVVLLAIASRRNELIPLAEDKIFSIKSFRMVIKTGLIFSIPLVSSILIDFYLRILFVPDALFGLNIGGMLSHIRMTLQPMGYVVSQSVVISWSIFVLSVIALSIIQSKNRKMYLLGILAWVICIILGCIAGLVLERSDLGLIPGAIFSFGLAMALQQIFCSGQVLYLKVITLSGIFFFSSITWSESRITLLGAHPQSFQAVISAAIYIYGEYASRAIIPLERRKEAEVYLHAYGIDSAEHLDDQKEKLMEEAKKNGSTPPANGALFMPRNFLGVM